MNPLCTPLLRRRLASMLYESMLLFGVIFIPILLLDSITQSHEATTLRDVRQFVVFLVLALYFLYFWSRGGQTLAMKTWRIKLVMPGHARVPLKRAALRYLLCWLWFLPALALNFALGFKGWNSILVIIAGMLAWAATILLNPERQFLHDMLAGTRLVEVAPPQGK